MQKYMVLSWRIFERCWFILVLSDFVVIPHVLLSASCVRDQVHNIRCGARGRVSDRIADFGDSERLIVEVGACHAPRVVAFLCGWCL